MSEPLHLEPFPTFSPNGSGVIVTTNYGNLNYDSEEFTYYQNLFKILDVQNKGFVRVESPQFLMLFLRTDATWKNIEKAIIIVLHNCSVLGDNNISSHEPDDLVYQSIKFYPWLMLCKLLAHSLEVRRDPSDKMFKNIHNTSKRNILNFKLGQVVRKFCDGGILYKRYKVQIVGWQLYGEDFQNQHVKFKVVSRVRMINQTNLKISTFQNEPELFIVERRYSEFEAFAGILHKNFRGIVTPPLPLKSIKYLSQNDAVLAQRAIQLQMFLDYLSSHPDLNICYELSVFLEAPSPGLKHFIDLYASVEGGQVMLNKRNEKPLNQIEEVVKIIQDGAQAVSNGAQVVVGPNNKAVELLSSFWGAVKKNIAVLTQPAPTYTISAEDTLQIHKTTKFLEVVVSVSKNLDNAQQHQLNCFQELNKLGQSLKSMSEFELVPDLIKNLQFVSSSLGSISQTQQDKLEKSLLKIAVPMTFLGRYIENYKASVAQHSSSLNALNEAHHREDIARKRVESMLEHQRLSGIAAVNSSTSVPQPAFPIDEEDNDYESLPSSNFEINEIQRTTNEAQLELCQAESHCEEMKTEEQNILRFIRKESRRIQYIQRHQILGYMVQYVQEQAETIAHERKMWENVLKSLDS